ncbi:MAG TPA: PAS domain-containing sensor histidine kinase [Burkholderiales bacterium]
MSHVSTGGAGGAVALRWAVPLAIGAIGVFYQITIGESFEARASGHLEHALDLFLFGVVNPALAYWGWTVIARARQAAHLLDALDVVSRDAFVCVGPDGRIGFWSRQAEVLLGYSSGHANGRALRDLLGPQGELLWLQLRDKVRRSGLVRGQESVCRSRGGQEIPVELSARPVLDDVGRSRGMLVVFRDIRRRNERTDLIAQLDRRLTEKVQQLARANAELEEASRSQADLLSLALHEVRAPLAGIVGAAERIESGCDSPTASCTRMLGVVRGQVGRLEGFAGQVLKAARAESGSLVLEREPTTVAAIVEQVIQQFRAGNSMRRLQVAVSRDLPAVYADRDCMVQVLCNLVGNADKYSPPGEEIEIEAREEGRHVQVSVRDHGPGLSAEALDRAFEKFYRAHPPETRAACGHGLGLYISRQIVLGHGGDIRAENHPTGGAMFCFTIPMVS